MGHVSNDLLAKDGSIQSYPPFSPSFAGFGRTGFLGGTSPLSNLEILRGLLSGLLVCLSLTVFCDFLVANLSPLGPQVFKGEFREREYPSSKDKHRSPIQDHQKLNIPVLLQAVCVFLIPRGVVLLDKVSLLSESKLTDERRH